MSEETGNISEILNNVSGIKKLLFKNIFSKEFIKEVDNISKGQINEAAVNILKIMINKAAKKAVFFYNQKIAIILTIILCVIFIPIIITTLLANGKIIITLIILLLLIVIIWIISVIVSKRLTEKLSDLVFKVVNDKMLKNVE